MDFEKIKSAAEGYKADMSAFLRAMISHPVSYTHLEARVHAHHAAAHAVAPARGLADEIHVLLDGGAALALALAVRDLSLIHIWGPCSWRGRSSPR